MALKIMNLKQKARIILKNYYHAIIFFIILIFIFLGIKLIKYFTPQKFEKSEEHFILLSYNKILYVDESIKDEQLKEAINSYETGYIEKAKFLFNSVLARTSDPKIKKVALVNLANIFDDYNQYELAIEYLNKAKEIDSKDFIIYHNLGIVYKHLKDYPKAIESFEKAINYNKRFLKSYLSLGSLYFYLNKFEEAYKYYEKAAKLNPELFEAKYNSAVCLLKSGKISEAINILEESINSEQIPAKLRAKSAQIIAMHNLEKNDLDKALFYLKKSLEIYEDFDAYYKIGQIYYLTGEYSKALDNFKKAYILNQNNIDSVAHLAELYYRFGEFEESLKYYKYLLEKSEKKSELFLTIGEIYYKTGDYQNAIEYYNKVLDSNTGLSPDIEKIVYVNLGNLYSAMNKYEEALKSYYKAIEFDKLDVNIYYNIGVLALNMKDYNLAIDNFNKGLEIAPSNLLLNLLSARTYLLMGDRDKAIITYNKIIEKFPQEITPYFELATLYYKISKFNEAKHYYELILNLNPSIDIQYKIYLNLGVIAQRLGNYDESIQLLNKAYAINSIDPYVNYNLGVSYLNANNLPKAKEYLKTVLRLKSDDNLRALTHLALGNCYYKEKQVQKAKLEYESALKYNPGLTEAHYNLKFIEGKL